MSNALVCDNCGAVLPLNARGEADTGEDAAWIKIAGADQSFDLCTRQCAHELLDSPPFVRAIDDWLETISEIAATIREVSDDDE